MVSDHIRNKLSQVPHRPGVYLMKDRFGTVIYVGKARDLRRRVSQYFHPSRRLGWDLKFNALVEAIHDFDVHVVRSEPESVLLEGKLIKEFRPRYNISFRDDKRFLLVKVNLNDPIPRFNLTRLRTDDGARYFGPFAGSGAARRTLALIRHRFNLRGCRPLTPGEADYRHCLYAHLKVCTAPCIGNVTSEQYRMQVTAACDFLDGQCAEMATELETEMKQAAANLEFERAARLRDLIQDVKRTTQRTEKFERIPYTLPVAVNPEAELEALGRVLGLSCAPDRIEGFDISNISGTFKVASMVSFWRGRPDRANYRRFRIKAVAGQDDFACMAETIRRRYSRLLAELGLGSAAPAGRSPSAAAEGEADASPQDLQRAADDVSARYHGRPVRLDTDAAALAARPMRDPVRQEGREHEEQGQEQEQGQEREREREQEPEQEPGQERELAGQGQRSDTPTPDPRHPAAAGTARPPLKPRLPDLILVDGGRGQVNAASAELEKLGLAHVAVIGLAKEFEEIYRPGREQPVRLGLDHPAVKLLQRIRDESHRVANSYNAQLRLKRISESLLDEFPGIGEARKAALLKRFGSVHRLKRATLEEIASVPGFGGEAAARLKSFLEARTASP